MLNCERQILKILVQQDISGMGDVVVFILYRTCLEFVIKLSVEPEETFNY